ncbi:hypothetical protein ACHAPT_007481 [Fusarium lateritium]
MASTFEVPPASLHDQDRHPTQAFPASDQQRPSTSSIDSNQLPPTLSRADSESLSPINYLETPGSNSSLDQYQPSDYSDFEEDPFFGADFNNIERVDPIFFGNQDELGPSISPGLVLGQDVDSSTYPLTPEHTASVHTRTPQSDLSHAIKGSVPPELPNCISPQVIQKQFNPPPIVTQTSLTPSQSSSCRSSEDGLAPSVAAMACQSPRVTVSMWGKDDETPIHTSIERSFEDSPTTVRGGFESAGDLISSSDNSASRDSTGQWRRNSVTGHAGLDPNNRPLNETSSINELATARKDEERKGMVGDWLTNKMNDLSVQPTETSQDTINELDRPHDDPHDEVPFNRETENRFIPGQTYYRGQGEMNQNDYNLIAADRNWADAPMVHAIRNGADGKHQPETSAAAMERFERMYRDTDSIISRAATWGTRRRSLPSLFDLDMSEVTSGGILKKFSVSRGDKGNKPGGLLRGLGELVRRPSTSQIRKRNRTGNDDESLPGSDSRGSQDSKRESISTKRESLAPPVRMGSWGKKPMPSINTAIVSMGSNIASIGTTHARNGSVSATPVASVASPKSPFGSLSIKGSIRRQRSKSDLPKPTPATIQTESHPTLVSMWKRETGGPPVAALAKTKHTEYDDEDEDDEDMDESDMKTNPNIIDNITPNLEGFQQHIIDLNPDLANANTYLVERIAYQQVQRYKSLLKNKVNHLGLGARCPSGILCIARGGSANLLDQNNSPQELDPLSSPNDIDDGTPVEGAINHESFRQDIPMPPTSRLPAEFECQLCYASKKFTKPSDWTKHVHEDVQPFTCTWDKCREPKMFKRKADWVRHENEGHRHLEWWTCDVEACHHQCYRRDNFLQHLVREHKYPEPKVKTKAAIKKAGGAEPTWQKVEQCHRETTKRPQDEPCRFCGKAFPTWKKLTVHLANHMEQISLPVLRLVDAKASELEADTVISPIQDPPPRNLLTTPVDQTSTDVQFPVGPCQIPSGARQMPYQQPGHLIYQPVMPTEAYQHAGFYPDQFGNVGPNPHAEMGMHPINHSGFNHAAQMQEMPVTRQGYVPDPNTYMMAGNGVESYPQMNALGLQQNHGVPMQQMGYDGIMDPSSGNGSPFSAQGSVSPYSHSPNLNANNNNGGNMWSDGRMPGY